MVVVKQQCSLLWRTCRVTVDGDVYGVTGSKLKPWKSKGYLRVETNDIAGERERFYVHRLVAYTFIGPPPTPEHEVAHIDGNRTHNRVCNLKWSTKVENAADRKLHGTQRSASGTAHPFSKLTDENVLEMRELFSLGVSTLELAEHLGVSEVTVRCAVEGKTWRHVK